MSSLFKIIKKNYPLIPGLTWGFLILYLTLRPKKSFDFLTLPFWLEGLPIDKLAHFVFWGIWYGLYSNFYLSRSDLGKSKFFNRRGDKKERLCGIVVMIGTGAFVEVAQFYLNWGREAEWTDLLADTAGILIAAIFW